MPLTEQKKERYAKLIEKCPRFELKGKNNLYTSANGHMFSMFNKDGDFGIRFSKEKQDHYIKELGTGHLISYGATMRGYVRMPELQVQIQYVAC